MSNPQARLLFGSGALFNFAAGLPFLVNGELAGRLLGMAPAPTYGVFERFVGFAIVLFGWMYFMIARDPVTYRPYILAGIVGKLGTVIIAWAALLEGLTNLPFPMLVLGDLVYAILFWRYLRTH
ncbi:hypothetical protein [Pseudokordiimonas caeni]|uniref:hypothetical protein n=1 Tax=Pseudokordiimonas caeni TaxID=2997908 RepID=UPI002811D0C9|nr:hypothetical protein [Pseudokordiimonas caeni]